ncbi:NADH-quinone oxidoreductase subunit M [Rhodococcus sp. 14-2470-1b]|uniref:NADH-quinone oxidoreductase subunit M n=1 Tax=Rhodococcus sp. 14-2470-1b TaxID=2023149 RepID=UPI000B9BFBBD|nr:NADH-quinone oxidoreductase subunit M [Rhodococcus sp. 14-2470-1b]OZF42837.1 NADH-quinone oxidoreductase subunit M [Rhodococcus sp. 14-2470-1b]
MVNTFPWLTMLWLLPVAGAVLTLILPRTRPQLAKVCALATSLLTLAVAVVLFAGFDPSGDEFQFVESHWWIESFGARYELGIDGIALVLVLLTTVLLPILLVAGWNDPRVGQSTHVYVASILLVESMVLMSFCALDVLLFYVFFEAMLIPMYFLIGGFGGPGRAAAAVKFLLYNLVGGLVMLAAVIGLYVVARTFSFREIADTAALGDLGVTPGVLNALFLGFMFAFAVKAPLWPFHSWLPDAAVESTPATAVLMMAVVDKVGTFAMLRYCLQLFPESSSYFAPVIVTLAVVGIVYGAVLAIAQTDVMRLIAYTSISHFGFIILGIFAMTSQGQAGSALYMVNHGLSTAALFLVAGFLVSRRGTRVISHYGGVQKVAPVLAGSFLVAGLATLSLPGLAPFVSEFLVLIGTFAKYHVAAIVASIALVLSAIYILWLYQRVMTGPRRAENDGMKDLVPRELAVMGPLIVLLVVLGVYPKPLLDIVSPAVQTTVTTVQGIEDVAETPEGPR